jgi:hypothetical protein
VDRPETSPSKRSSKRPSPKRLSAKRLSAKRHSRKRLSRKRHLPRHPKLEQLRKRAKELLRGARAGDEKSVGRLRESHPTFEQVADSPALHDAQWVLAREYGFESWTKLVQHVEQIEKVLADIERLPPEALIDRLALRDWRAWWPIEHHLSQNMGIAMDAVLAGIEHENPRVRTACALLLDHGGDDRCIAPLRKALADPVPKVRLTALHSLQCQRCKNEPLPYDVIPDMIRMAEQDPSPRVRASAFGGMGIQPPSRRLLEAIEQALARDRNNFDERGALKLLRHHMHDLDLEELLQRIESQARRVVRQAAAASVVHHPPDPNAASRLAAQRSDEENDILRRVLERGRQHHAKEA